MAKKRTSPEKPGKTGEQLKKEGQDRVEKNAGEDFWLECVAKATEYGSRVDLYLMSDFRMAYPDLNPHHCNAWGSYPRKMAKLGLIKVTDEWARSFKASCHARPSKLLLSLNFNGDKKRIGT